MAPLFQGPDPHHFGLFHEGRGFAAMHRTLGRAIRSFFALELLGIIPKVDLGKNMQLLVTRASLLGARTLLGAPGLATRNKKLLVTRASLLVAIEATN